MTTRALASAVALSCLLAGFGACDRHDVGASGPETSVLHLPAGPGLELRDVVFDPPDGVRSARAGSGWLAVDRSAGSPRVVVRIRGMCPVTLDARSAPVTDVRSLFDPGGDRAQVGFDAPFEVLAKAGCADGEQGQVNWRQTEGPPLADLRTSDGGFRLSARTLPFDAVHPEPLPEGIIPITPRTQGRYVLVAVWTRAGWPEVRRTITITSVARASGLSSLAVSQQVLLAGPSWRIRERPRGGRADIRPDGPRAIFAADAPGRWRLEDAEGHELTVQALWHDKTPVDCGRRECHPSAADGAIGSPMSRALESALAEGAGSTPAPEAISCRLECHVTGELGLHDGGFLDVAASMGWQPWGRPAWRDLPQPLRRLGGVRCTACHGPAAIPETSDRAKILRADVCAVCHDAPPAYVHVQQWRESKMSLSDQDARARSGPLCVRCHTTGGFLAAIGVREPHDGAAEPPMGIACAACHAPHGAHRGDALVRAVAVPGSIDSRATERMDPRAFVCLTCHSPAPGEPLPSASAAALWLGSVRLPESSSRDGASEAVTGPAAHGAVVGGCIGCHGARNGAQGGETDHSFKVNRDVCAACHAKDSSLEATSQAAQRSLRARAIVLQNELATRCSSGKIKPASGPDHADLSSVACPSPDLARARYEVALVLEDPAAAVHNAAFARSLLADAEARLHCCAK